MAAGPVFGVVDTDAGAFGDAELFGVAGGDVEVGAEEVVAIETFVDVHGVAEQTGAGGLAGKLTDRLQRAEQGGGGVPFLFGDDVHAEIHAVDHVAVGEARR